MIIKMKEHVGVSGEVKAYIYCMYMYMYIYIYMFTHESEIPMITMITMITIMITIYGGGKIKR